MSGRHLWTRLSFIRDTLSELSPTYLAGTKPFGNHRLSSWKNYKAYFGSPDSLRDPGVFPGPNLPHASLPGPTVYALWQPTNPRNAARFLSFSARKKSTSDEAGRVSPCRPLAQLFASSSARVAASREAAAVAPASHRRLSSAFSSLRLTPTVSPPTQSLSSARVSVFFSDCFSPPLLR